MPCARSSARRRRSPPTSCRSSRRPCARGRAWGRSATCCAKCGANTRRQVCSEEERAVPIKVVIAKPGLDGHDRGAKVVARALRDAGMEVVYTGIFQTPESILRAVIEEDAAVLGLSSLSGAHLEYAEELCEMLRENGMGDVLFLVGGTIPDEDAERLKSVGVTEVFGPGTPTGTITDYIRRNVRGALPGGDGGAGLGDVAEAAAAQVVEDVRDHPH